MCKVMLKLHHMYIHLEIKLKRKKHVHQFTIINTFLEIINFENLFIKFLSANFCSKILCTVMGVLKAA